MSGFFVQLRLPGEWEYTKVIVGSLDNAPMTDATAFFKAMMGNGDVLV